MKEVRVEDSALGFGIYSVRDYIAGQSFPASIYMRKVKQLLT